MSSFEMDHTSLVGHNHTTTELTKITNFAYCNFCWSTEPSACWRCTICWTYMCKNCIKLPLETSHWFHPQHPLRMYNPCSLKWGGLNEGKGICEGCFHLLDYHRSYMCTQCEFHLCLECCASTTSRRPLQWESKKLTHYSHVHKLTKCRFREGFPSPGCGICEVKMWGVGYACVRCYYFVHESCIYTPRVIQHPSHPLHPLRLLDYKSSTDGLCNICGVSHFNKNRGLCCYGCKFYLHIRCADYVLRVIKLECHTHGLICCQDIPLREFTKKKCHLCGMHFDAGKRYLVFRCVECDLNFHVDCLSIPRSVKHRYHQHTLTLTGPCDDDFSEEYYCDICEARRHPISLIYRCEQCNFYGHIECLLSKEEGFPQFWSCLEAKSLNKAELQTSANHSSNKQIQHVFHDHPLNLKNATNQRCCMCKLEINGQAYRCEKCEEMFWVHEKCAKLPENLDHPLHPNHKLSLLSSCQLNVHGYFICSLCREISEDFNFSCRTCDFVIDIRCALTIESGQPFDNREYKKSLRRLVHNHELTLANARRDTRFEFLCDVCEERCLGLMYCCMQCDYWAHKACVEWPSVVEPHPLHPKHRLQLSRFKFADDWKCYACDGFISTLGYKCEKYRAPNQNCRVDFHLECGVSLACLLKQTQHDHHFYYFHKPPHIGLLYHDREVCYICKKETDGSYYRCLKCKCCFHLRCLQLPQTAKHKWHLHWLNFKDLVDYGGYYCDVCEEPRDTQHPVYCCEHCNFVTHVECIVSKENASSVTLQEIRSDDEDIPECSPVSQYSTSTSS